MPPEAHGTPNDNNKDYLDQVYYAIGNIYLMQKDTLQAIAAYEKGNEKATRSGIEKGVLLLKLGDLYWDMEKYNDAQRCYGEAIGLLDKDRPDYEELSKRSKVLDELVPYTDAVHLQDSLQELAKMPEKERLEAIDRVIEALKKKEKEERDKAQEAEVEQALAETRVPLGNRNQPTATPTPAHHCQQANGQWYFYNQMAVNKGKQTFQKQWGKRENADDWQRATRPVVNLDMPGADRGTPDGQSGIPEKLETSRYGRHSADSRSRGRGRHPGQRPAQPRVLPGTDTLHRGAGGGQQPHHHGRPVQLGRHLQGQARQPAHWQRSSWCDLPPSIPTSRRWTRHGITSSCSTHAMGDTWRPNCLAPEADYPDSEWTILLSDPYFKENARFGEHIEDSLYAATYEAFKEGNDMIIRQRANSRRSASRWARTVRSSSSSTA